MILLGLLSVISQVFYLAFSVVVRNGIFTKDDDPEYTIALSLLALAFSFGMTATAVFTFKYWNISLLIECAVSGKDSSVSESKRNVAFFIFVFVNATAPIIYCILVGFYFEKHDTNIEPGYRFSLVLVYASILGSYMLLADALRRLYKNLKGNTNVKVNKKMMCAYFVSAILYFVSIVVCLGLTISSKYDYYSKKALLG